MSAAKFISGATSFKSKAASVSIAVSFFVMVMAMAVTGGFRSEIRSRISAVAGDIMVTPLGVSPLAGSQEYPMEIDSILMDKIRSIRGVASVESVVYSTLIVKKGDLLHAALFKGVDCRGDSSAATGIKIPRSLSKLLDADLGEGILAYHVSERLTLRKFSIEDIYESIVTDDDKLVARCRPEVLRRMCGLKADQCSALQVTLEEKCRDNENIMENITDEISILLFENATEASRPLLCTNSRRVYSSLFEWLNLIDGNMRFILLLMMIVAAFNMTGGLLIMLFENIPMIGMLKAMGMRNAEISKIFLLSALKDVGKSLLWGNLAAGVIIILENLTHAIHLDPDNYFIDFLPMYADISSVLACDIAAAAFIMIVLFIPCRFISSIDPATTIKTA